jgi:glyoxylase-like metal-dependent hydrolase (beta-lactamase superfamily II)
MRVHHLDCACMCPFGGARLGGVDRMVGHCLLVEGANGLVLIDTGFGTNDADRLPRVFRIAAGAVLAPEHTAIAQVRRLGFLPEDVRDIVVTHLDLDHAGGLVDFPNARVHVHAHELDAARNRGSLRERFRYIPAQLAHGPQFVTHDAVGEPWKGFAAVRSLGLGDGILAVPLAGHTRGHWAIAVDRGDRWLLHCGDQYANKGMLSVPSTAPPGIRAFERSIAWDHARVLANQQRIIAIAREPDVSVFSAHDVDEFSALRGISA